MLTYIIRRLLLAIPTLLFISLVIFLLLDMAPGDPTSQIPLTVPPEVKEKIRLALGLGEPIHVRYLLWLKQFFVSEPLHIIANMTGWDIGGNAQRVISWQTRSPVADIIAQRLPQTLWVVGLSYLIGVLIAVPIGVVSAYRQYSLFDQIGTFVSMIGFSVPTFFTGVLMIVIFSVKLGWFPSIYDTTLRVNDFDSFLRQVQQMVMPVTVLALYNAAQISRFMRSSMLDNLNQDYVRTARAKGVSEALILWKHALKNVSIPLVTMVGLQFGRLLAGTVVIEIVFAWPGIGFLTVKAVRTLDYPVVQAAVVVVGAAIALVNLATDVVVGYLDPRIRYG
jgi:peptide/nickel transport system permease protein